MILDTNALSALQGRDQNLIRLVRSLPVLILNIVSLGEYRYGVDGSRYRDKLLVWLDALIKKSEVVSPDLDTLPIYSRIRHQLKQGGTPLPANDIWIAALAIQHQMPIVSQDHHFDLIADIQRVSWKNGG